MQFIARAVLVNFFVSPRQGHVLGRTCRQDLAQYRLHIRQFSIAHLILSLHRQRAEVGSNHQSRHHPHPHPHTPNRLRFQLRQH